MKSRFVQRLKWVLCVGALAGLSVAADKAIGSRSEMTRSTDAMHAQITTPADRRHMHMRNWALEPTGIPGVSPLDPTTIPKFVSELTKPPVFVPDDLEQRTPHYTVTYKAIRQQLLPPGFPSTQVYAYGGVANFSEPDERPEIRTTF